MYLDTMQSFLGFTPATCNGLSWLLWKLRAFQYIFCFCFINILLLSEVLIYFSWKTCLRYGIPSILCRADIQPAIILLAGVPTSSTDVREKKASISRILNWGEMWHRGIQWNACNLTGRIMSHPALDTHSTASVWLMFLSDDFNSRLAWLAQMEKSAPDTPLLLQTHPTCRGRPRKCTCGLSFIIWCPDQDFWYKFTFSPCHVVFI